MMKRLLFVLLFCAAAFGQGTRVDIPQIVGGTGRPVPNVQVTVCTATATGLPCSPQVLTYTDATLGTACSAGFQVVLTGTSTCQATTDALGNGGFWVPSGKYKYTLTGPSIVGGGQTYTVIAPCDPSNCQMASAAISGALTAGSASVTGNTSIKGPRPWADVMAFGAVGDGTTDDTTAIQNAIYFACNGTSSPPSGNVCASNGGSGIVFFPPPPNANGCYKITAPIQIYSTVTLQGTGTTSSKLCKTTNTVGSGSITAGSGVGRTPTSCSGGPCVDSFAVDSLISVFYPSAGNTGYATMWRIRDLGLFCQATNGCAYGIYAPRATRFEVKESYVFGNCSTGKPATCGGVTGYAFYTHDSFLYRLEGNVFEEWTFGPSHVNDGSGAGTGTSAVWHNNFSNLIGRSCYNAYGLSYSTLIDNACDNFNTGVEDLPALSNDFTAYAFVLSQGISVVGGGAEAVHGGVITSDGSTVTVTGGFKTFANTGFTSAGSFPGIIVVDNVAGGGTAPSLTIEGTIFSAMTSPGSFLNIILQDGGSLVDTNSVLPTGGSSFIGFGGSALETDVNASGITMTNSAGASSLAPHKTNLRETTTPSAAGSQDICYADSTLHGRECNYNNSAWTPLGSRAILTADWTCGTGGTVASCVAATIIGSGGGVPWTFSLPLVANSLQLDCDGVVGQATAATSNQWNLLTATNGATNVTASYVMATAATAMAVGAVTDQASTTTTFQITPSWTLGGTATKMPFHIHAAIQGASASGTVLSVQLVAPTVGDLVTIYQGSGCWIHP